LMKEGDTQVVLLSEGTWMSQYIYEWVVSHMGRVTYVSESKSVDERGRYAGGASIYGVATVSRID